MGGVWYNKGMITYYFRSKKEDVLEVREDIRPGTWVHAENPTQEELDTLAGELGLDRGLLGDAVDFYEVPRFEDENEVAYFYTRFPHESNGEIGTAPMLFAVTPTAVVTVSRQHPAFLNGYIEGKALLYTTQRTKLFLQLVQAVNSSYRRTLVTIRKNVQKSRVNLRNIKNADIVRLVSFETTLNDFLAALTPTHTALRTVLSQGHLELFDDDRDLVEDIQLENQQIVESAKANLKTIQNIRSSYTAIVTNNLNSVIKLLTSLTIILTIPTVLGSLYGMNVPLPFAESPFAFFGIVLAAVLVMGVAALLFSKRDWL